MKNIDKLVASVVKLNKLQNKFLEHSLHLLSDRDSEILDDYLTYCLNNGLSFDFLAEAYDLFSKDTLKEQVFFTRHKRYRYSTYQDVAPCVYHNREYMNKYVYGLALTSFLWPNHLQIFKFFQDKLPRNLKGNYLDIGPGHGLFMMEAMRSSHYVNFWGIDISPTSVDITQKILSSGSFGPFKNFTIINGDFLIWETKEKFDAIVAGDVLEHVENPPDFLSKVRDLSTASSYIYLTTAINSPVIDHIYLFESKEQLINLITSSGFRIQDMLVVPYTGKTIEESEANKLPVKIAMVLKKIDG